MCVASEAEEGFFERGGGGLAFEGCGRVECDEATVLEDGDAIGEEFDFGEGVGSEKQRGFAGPHDLRFQEMAEGRGGDGVEAAGWLVEKKDARGVNEGASEGEALNRAGRKSADLAIERFGEFELCGELRDAIARGGSGEMIEATEEEEIFACGEARIKALVGAGVVTERAADGTGRRDRVMSRDGGMAGGGKKKRGEDAEESGFAGAVCAEERDGFAVAEFERDILKSGQSGLLKGLEKGAPASAGGRKEFGEGLKGDRGIGHREVIARPTERNNLADCGLKGVGHVEGKLQGDQRQGKALE